MQQPFHASIGTPLGSVPATGNLPQTQSGVGGVPSTDAFLGHTKGATGPAEFYIGSVPVTTRGPSASRGSLVPQSEVGMLEWRNTFDSGPSNSFSLPPQSEVGALDAGKIPRSHTLGTISSAEARTPVTPVSPGAPVSRARLDAGGSGAVAQGPGSESSPSLQHVFSPRKEAGSARSDWRSADWGSASIPRPPPESSSPPVATVMQQEAMPTFSGFQPVPSQGSLVPPPPPQSSPPLVPTVLGVPQGYGTPGFPSFMGPPSSVQGRLNLPMSASGCPQPTPPATLPQSGHTPPSMPSMPGTAALPSLPGTGAPLPLHQSSPGSASVPGKVWSAQDLAATLSLSNSANRVASAPPPGGYSAAGSAALPLAAGSAGSASLPASVAGSVRASVGNFATPGSAAGSARGSVAPTAPVTAESAANLPLYTSGPFQPVASTSASLPPPPPMSAAGSAATQQMGGAGGLSLHTFAAPVPSSPTPYNDQLVLPGSISLVGATLGNAASITPGSATPVAATMRTRGGQSMSLSRPGSAASVADVVRASQAAALYGAGTAPPTPQPGSVAVPASVPLTPQPGSASIPPSMPPTPPPGSANVPGPGPAATPPATPSRPGSAYAPTLPGTPTNQALHWTQAGSVETLPPDAAAPLPSDMAPAPPTLPGYGESTWPATSTFPGGMPAEAGTVQFQQQPAPPDLAPLPQMPDGASQAELDQRISVLEQKFPPTVQAGHMPDVHPSWSPAAMAAAEAVLASEAAQAVANKAIPRWSRKAHAAAEAVMAAELAEQRAIEEDLRNYRHFIEPPKHGGLFGEKFCTDPLKGCYVMDCFVDKERVAHREVDLVYRRATNLKVVKEDMPFISWLAGMDHETVDTQAEVIDKRSWRKLDELQQVERRQWMVEVQ